MLKLDTLFNTIGALFFLIISLLAQIHPPTETEKQHRPGDLGVNIQWAAGPDDVDIWVSGPGDRRVGYLSKQGALWSLLRDDLGDANDLTLSNFESAYTRGIPDGEYGVNVHCYSCRAGVVVTVEIGIVGGNKLWVGSVEVGPKQERTALRFKMKDGRLVAGSNSQVFKAIRGNT